MCMCAFVLYVYMYTYVHTETQAHTSRHIYTHRHMFICAHAYESVRLKSNQRVDMYKENNWNSEMLKEFNHKKTF